MSKRSFLVLLAAAGGVAACQPMQGGATGAAIAAERESAPARADSIFPIDEEIRRFRAQVGGRASALTGGADSADELVARFIAALAAEDVSALAAMRLQASEFIDLYYPHTRFTRRPYELAPQLVWFQLENYGARGMSRALARFGGRPLRLRDWRCEVVEEEGPNRIHGGCTVDVSAGEAAVRTLSLFGQILERDGAFKFINHANGL